MVKNIFRGMGVALITPFKADFSVDYESLDRLLDYLISEGADFLCILATTGETPCLSAEGLLMYELAMTCESCDVKAIMLS